MRSTRTGSTFVLIVATALSAAVHAMTPATIRQDLEATARAEVPGFSGFSAQRGAEFFQTRHGNDWSCASCHTANPSSAGRHASTAKLIAPLAPAANAARFTDPARVDKWFRRNCNDVLGRACTAQEKGDVLQYLMSVR
jgi:hypothetical protein